MASLFFHPPLSSYAGDEANPCSSTCSGECPSSATQDVLQFPWGFSTWSWFSVVHLSPVCLSDTLRVSLSTVTCSVTSFMWGQSELNLDGVSLWCVLFIFIGIGVGQTWVQFILLSLNNQQVILSLASLRCNSSSVQWGK